MKSFSLRAYEAQDADFVISSWLYSYARSRYGVSVGAHIPRAQLRDGVGRPAEDVWRRFWSEQKAIIEPLAASAHIEVACDAADPMVIWGWACTSGDTVHHVLVKRSVHRASAAADARGVWLPTTGLSGEIYRDLLGDRLSRSCGFTFELVDMYRRELRAQGVSMPTHWFADTTYFARNAVRP